MVSEERRLTNRVALTGPVVFARWNRSFSAAVRSARPRSLPTIRLLKEGLWPHDARDFVMNRDGSNLRQVRSSAARTSRPAWHPDGKRLIFASNIKIRKPRFDIS